MKMHKIDDNIVVSLYPTETAGLNPDNKKMQFKKLALRVSHHPLWFVAVM